jgi:hypothetical protein
VSFHQAVVTNNLDPEGRGRVRLRIPHMLGPAETGWARPIFETSPPNVGESVWASMESGDQDSLIFTPRSVGAGDVAIHEAAANPHPQYLISSEHLGAADPHPQYLLSSAHLGAANPHTQYVLSTGGTFTGHLNAASIAFNLGTEAMPSIRFQGAASSGVYNGNGGVWLVRGGVGKIAARDSDVYVPGPATFGENVWVSGGSIVIDPGRIDLRGTGFRNHLRMVRTGTDNSQIDLTPGTNTNLYISWEDAANPAYGTTRRYQFSPLGTIIYQGGNMEVNQDAGFWNGTERPDQGSTPQGMAYRTPSDTAYVLVLARNGAPPLVMTRGNSNGDIVEFRRGNSQVGSVSVTTTATAYNTSSDHRLKTVLEEADPAEALQLLLDLHIWKYRWNLTGEEEIGAIAHEMAEVLPNAVTGEKDAVNEDGDPVYQGVDYSKAVPLIIRVLQHAFREIEEVRTIAQGIPEWVPWTSGRNEDLYQVGDQVRHNGKTWEATVGNNHWEPGAPGHESLWREV